MADRSGYIGRAPGDSSVIIARKSYEPTGVQTDFTFNSGYTPGYCDVYLNGVRLIDEKDFTASDGSTVGLTSAAQSGDVVELVVYKAYNLGVPLADVTGNLDVTGNISASSSITGATLFGDGSNLSGIPGVAVTQYIDANSLTVIGSPGVSTITRLGVTDAVVTGIITANGLSGNVTGAAITITGNATFNSNVTIGGTLTYEDVTNIDSLGIVTARAGVNVSGGQFLVGSGVTIGNAGVATFSGTGDVHLLDNVRLNVGDGSELAIYHNGSNNNNFINASSGNLNLVSDLTQLQTTGGETAMKATANGAVELRYNDSKKFETTNDGTVTTGIATATTFSGAVSGTTGTFSQKTTANATLEATEGLNVTAGVSTFAGAVYIKNTFPRLYLLDTDSNSDFSVINSNGSFMIYDDSNSASRFTINSSGVGAFNSDLEVAGSQYITDSIIHTGDTDTKIRFSGADTISLETGGVQALEITSGRVLKIPGEMTGNNVAQILNHSDGLNFYGSSDSGTPNDFIFCAASSAASEKFRITDTGQVGINSNAPNFDLDIRGGGGRDGVSVGTTVFIYSQSHATNTSNKAELRFGFNHSGNNYAYGNIFLEEQGGNAFDGRMSFGVPYNNGGGGSSTRHVLQLQGSTGNVGIGTTIPVASSSAYNSAALHIHQTSNSSAGAQIHLTNGATGGAAGNGSHISMYTDDDLYISNQESDGQIKFATGGSNALTIDDSQNATFAGSVSDSKGDVRRIVYQNKTSGYTLVAADAGKAIHISTGGVTINDSLFSAGDAVTIINNSGSNQTITQGSGVTLYNTGDATTGNKTLIGRGMATVWFSSASIGYITGNFE